MNITELIEKTSCLIGKNRLITIAATANSPKQAADVARRLGFTEEKVKAIRFASIIRRDHGVDKFNEIFNPYEIVEIPNNVLSKIVLNLTLMDVNKRGEDYLNVAEIEYIKECIQALLTELKVNVVMGAHPKAPKWVGNRIKSEYSEG